MTGIIYKSIGGFYYVKSSDGILVECKPRGLFRKAEIKPVAGDRVQLAQDAGTWYINDVLPRNNVFIRPPVANVDVFFIVASMVQPAPNYLVLDKLSAIAVESGATPVVVVTKADLASPQAFLQAYETSGMEVLQVNAKSGAGTEALAARIAGKLCVFCGNSGVGKSTLLNVLLPAARRETAPISQKLGRGRHTTREVEIFETAGGLVADTPGFSSLDLQQVMPIAKENLAFAFPEMAGLIAQCRFSNCAHLSEVGCAVRQALAEGKISQSRYNSYAALYREAKENERY